MDGGGAIKSVGGLDEGQLRVDLAAAFRMAAKFGWQEAVANHFSVAVPADGKKFLLNPLWRHFSVIRASELILLDSDAAEPPETPPIDATAWVIHGTLHAKVPHARCVLHVHPPYATALACLADPEIKPVEQTCARFFKRHAVDTGYGGMADNAAEGLRLVEALGRHNVMMMGNHGVLATGETVAEAFDVLYHIERACRTLVLAYSTGRKLSVLSDEIAEKTARSWEDGGAQAKAHFDAMKRLLDAEEPGYAD